jgi:hypothetical protein
MRNHLAKILLIVLLVSMAASCRNDDNGDVTPVIRDITGQWTFILIPGQVYRDTTLIHGQRGTDFEVYSSSSDEVYLQQTGNQVSGYLGPLKIAGTVIGSQVNLRFYEQPEGTYVKERPVEEMVYFSDMTLQLNEDMTMEGTGTYQTSLVYPFIILNTLNVKATRIPNTVKSHNGNMAVSNWENDLCRVLSTITSWVIAGLTDGIVRPMSSNCWLYHDGGGYFTFGHEGPGSVLPVFTTTLYYPFEVSCCHCREYGFNIALGGQNITYTVLKDLFLNHEPIVDLAAKLGFSDINTLIEAMDDFYSLTGEFAISLFYNCNTGSITLYANTQNGSQNEVLNSSLMQSMANAFAAHASHVYVYSGNSINDNYYLRRSPAFICNTPIVVCYLFGTNKAEYN